jgi:undecaprenyl-diphosphatase
MDQFELWQVLVLAVVQGIAEFLPISSDGHLVVIAPLLFGGRSKPQNMMDLTIVLHLGTLGSILVFYRQRIARLVGEDRRVLWLICLGTVPAVILVLVSKSLFGARFEEFLNSPVVAGIMLVVTGVVLLWSTARPAGTLEYRELSWVGSLLIGTAQATAILPGLSRSGTTIAAGLGLGMSRASAATYSFLLAIPALAGAGAYEAVSMLKDRQPLSTAPAYLVVGAIVSFFVGLIALSALSRVLQRGQLHWFGWYCIGLGVAVTVWQLAI